MVNTGLLVIVVLFQLVIAFITTDSTRSLAELSAFLLIIVMFLTKSNKVRFRKSYSNHA